MSKQRDESILKIRDDHCFDVVVIGGGINGLGVYRELSLQGLRVLLVERSDFCSGCSAAPSRMIHGGLRYLENGEFDLVRESLRERDALLCNAPHLVKPLPTTIPVFSVFSGLLNSATRFFGISGRPASRGAVPIKIGLVLYDWITRKNRILPRHRFHGARKTLSQWPTLDPRLKFSATYHDAWISYPERLGVELVLDTQRLAPRSVALPYAELHLEAGQFLLHDHLTGDQHQITSRAIVNATGAWLDQTLRTLSGADPSARPLKENLVSGTKGSHVILDCPALYQALDGHMIYYENTDGRVCIVFPYLGKVLAGSTDIRVESAGRVRCEAEEQDYILAALRLVFPTVAIGTDSIVFSFSGIRPLPRSDSEFTGRISRGHDIRRIDGPVPLFCLIGGKWTTFRAFAAQTADVVLAELGKRRVADTLDLSIGGGTGFPERPATLNQELVTDHGISPERAAYLVDLYGTRARDVLKFIAGRNDDVPIEPSSLITGAELVFIATHENVTHLSDIFLRRTPLAIRGDVSQGMIEKVADILAATFDWSPERTRQEINDFTTELSSFYGVSSERLLERTTQRNRTCA